MIRTLFVNFFFKIKDRNTIAAIIASMLAALFVYTGMSKLLDNALFLSQLNRSPFIHPFVGFIGSTLPAGELVVYILPCCVQVGLKRAPAPLLGVAPVLMAVEVPPLLKYKVSLLEG